MKKIVFKLFISLLSLFIFLAILEGGLRVAGYMYSRRIISPAVEKGDDSLKILAVGDSYTVGGAGLDINSYPSKLQLILKENSFGQIAVINAGVCEINSSQAFKQIKKTTKRYTPEYVILLVGSTNRFNYAGYSQYAGGRKNIISNLRIYKMFRILMANLRGQFLRLRSRRVDTFSEPHFSDRQVDFRGISDFLAKKSEKSRDLAENRAQEGKGQEILSFQDYIEAARLDESQNSARAEIILKEGIEKNPKEVLLYLELGDYYCRQDNREKALAIYEQAIEISPLNEGIIYVKKANCLRSHQEYTEAESYYYQAIKIDPQESWGYIGLANCYREQGKLKEEKGVYRKGISLQPEKGWAYAGMANLLMGKGETGKAKEFYLKAIDREPENSFLYLSLAGCYRALGKEKKAENSYKKAMELGPENINVYRVVVRYYFARGDFRKVKDIYKRAAEYGHDWGYAGLLRLLRQVGSFEEVEAAYTKAIQKNSQSSMLYVSLADYYLSFHYDRGLFDVEKAKKKYRKAIEIDPVNARAYKGLADCYLEQGDFNTAKKFYKKVITLAPEKSWGYAGLGRLFWHTKELEKAEDMYRKAIERDPKNQSLYLDAVYYYKKQGRIEEAITMASKVIEIDPRSSAGYAFLGRLYIEAGDFASGLGYFFKGMEVNPESFPIYYNIMKSAYELQNKYDADYVVGVLDKIMKKNPAIAKDPDFLAYAMFYKDQQEWAAKINRWLEHDLQAIADFCRDNNIELIIQNYPYPYYKVNEILEGIAEKNSLIFIDNYSVFKELISEYGKDKYILDSDHCTPEGHKVMAENIYKILLQEGIIEKK